MTNKELSKRAKALSNILKKSERDIIARLLAANTFTPTEKAAILTAIENRLKRTAVHTDKWVVQNVPAAYRMGAKDTASALKVNAIFNQDDFVIIQSMIASSQINIKEFVSGMYRSSGRMLNDVTKERLRAKMLEGRITAGTMKKLKAELALELSKGLPGMIDRAGRKWTVENYSDMYARTDLMDKYNEGVVNQAIHNNQDLMYITSIGDGQVCELCEPWEGEVVSISGNDPDYPSLDDAYGEGVFHPRCYSSDTEVYTDNGWKLFKDVKQGDKIMSINPENHLMEWVDYTKSIDYHYKGEMLGFKSNSYDLLVTPDHDLYIGTNSHKAGGKEYIKWQFLNAEQASVKNHRHLRTVKWEGKDLESPIKSLTIEQYAYLLGAYLSEGYVDTHGYSEKIIICQSEANKENYREGLLEMGFYENTDKFLKTDREMVEHFGVLGKSWEKEIPRFFMDARPEIIKIFLENFIKGDGSIKVTEGRFKGMYSTDIVMHTSSEKLAGQLGELVFKIGKYPGYAKPSKPKRIKHKNGEYLQKHPCWLVRINNIEKSYYNLSPSIKHRGIQLERVGYNDKVYCLELGKNHIMLVRRNGKTAWQGNCRHRTRPYFD